MQIKEIFLKSLLQIKNKNFFYNSIEFNFFIKKNQNIILKILDDKNSLQNMIEAINQLLLKDKNYHLSLILLEILSLKLPGDFDIKFTLAKTCYLNKMYEISLIYLNQIPKEKLTIEHLRLFINNYFENQNYEKCINMIIKLREQEGKNFENTIILINCLRKIRKIKLAKQEYEYLLTLPEKEYEKFYTGCLINLSENKYDLTINYLEKNYEKYSEKYLSFHEIYGIVLSKYKRFDDAIHELKKAFTLGHKEHHNTLYRCYFSKFDFNNGYNSLEKSTTNYSFENYFLKRKFIKWNFEDINNQILIIYPGVGMAIGDQIFYFRYVKDLVNKFTQLKIYFCLSNNRTEYLFKGQGIEIFNFSNIEAIVIENNKKVFFSSLPQLAKTYFENKQCKIIKKYNFFPLNEMKLKFWKNTISSYKKSVNIGVNWKGNIKYSLDLYRSVNIEILKNIFNITEVNFFVLNNELSQDEIKFISNFKNVIIPDQKYFVEEKINSFSETIELMRSLDSIITTDTSIAHISACLDLKTYLMLEYSPYWYWTHENDKNYYQNKNLKIIKQTHPGDWFSVIEKLALEIQKKL